MKDDAEKDYEMLKKLSTIRALIDKDKKSKKKKKKKKKT